MLSESCFLSKQSTSINKLKITDAFCEKVEIKSRYIVFVQIGFCKDCLKSITCNNDIDLSVIIKSSESVLLRKQLQNDYLANYCIAENQIFFSDREFAFVKSPFIFDGKTNKFISYDELKSNNFIIKEY